MANASVPVGKHPDLPIKIFVALGVLAILLSVLMARALAQLLASEQRRFDACQTGERTDCRPSFVWTMFAPMSPEDQASSASGPQAATSSLFLPSPSATTVPTVAPKVAPKKKL